MPVVFGVLTTDTIDQALERSADDGSNKGREAALTAMSTANLLESVSSVASGHRVGFSVGKR